jgi:single-strand DNA-binding protein
MRNINKVILVGHCGKDAEVRYTPSGTPVANFSLATKEMWNDNTGKRNEKTEWHRIVTWGKLAEFCQHYITKGKFIWVEGSIQSRTWKDRDGNQRTSYEIKARDVAILEPKEARGDKEHVAEPAVDAAIEPAPEELPITDDDIPF